MVQLQDSILECMSHHALSNMLSNGTSEAHCAQILSCSSLGVGTWLTAWPIFPTFRLFSQFFTQHFVCDLDYLILQLQASLDVYAHIPLTLWVSTSYVVFMAITALEPMMQFATPLSPLGKMLISTWDKNNYMCFLQPHSIPFIDKSTLCLPKMTFVA
jgi:hypothetical protein